MSYWASQQLVVVAGSSDGVRQYGVCVHYLPQYLVLASGFVFSEWLSASVGVMTSKQRPIRPVYFREGGLRRQVQDAI